MRYVAAYLLATLGGKDSPNSADIEKILSSVGIEADAEKLKKVIGELNGKNIEELIAAGNSILKSKVHTSVSINQIFLLWNILIQTTVTCISLICSCVVSYSS
jgi:hypothetical protein